MNRRFIGLSLAVLLALTGGLNLVNLNVHASDVPKSSAVNSEKSDCYNQKFTKQQVIEDIDYILDVISRYHVSAVNGIPEEVRTQKEIEINNLTENVSIVEEWRIISGIISKFHDAHTTIQVPPLYKRIPFDISVENGKFICKTGDFEGYDVIAINDNLIPDIYGEFKKHFPHEIDEWVYEHFFERYTKFIPEWTLALAGIDTSKPVKVTFKKDKDVKSLEVSLSEIEVVHPAQPPYVSYEIDEKNKVGIFTLNCCEFDDFYMKTVDKFFEDVATKDVKNIIIDLRKNGGGTSQVTEYFAGYIKNIPTYKTCRCDIRHENTLEHVKSTIYTEKDIQKFKANKNLFDGKIFIATSHRTFSSALLFAEEFSDNNLATIIGDVPGTSPVHYGHKVGQTFELPNSKLHFWTTFKRWYRVDESKNPERLIPDVEVPAKDAINKIYKILKLN